MRKYTFACMNAEIDGAVVNDFINDQEAADFAADYEADCYRINPDGSKVLVYSPKEGMTGTIDYTDRRIYMSDDLNSAAKLLEDHGDKVAANMLRDMASGLGWDDGIICSGNDADSTVTFTEHGVAK